MRGVGQLPHAALELLARARQEVVDADAALLLVPLPLLLRTQDERLIRLPLLLVEAPEGYPHRLAREPQRPLHRLLKLPPGVKLPSGQGFPGRPPQKVWTQCPHLRRFQLVQGQVWTKAGESSLDPLPEVRQVLPYRLLVVGVERRARLLQVPDPLSREGTPLQILQRERAPALLVPARTGRLPPSLPSLLHPIDLSQSHGERSRRQFLQMAMLLLLRLPRLRHEGDLCHPPGELPRHRH